MDKVIDMLDENNISGHLVQNGTDSIISCRHNLKEYLISKEDDTYKLLEANLALNKKRKARFHEVDKFQNIDKMISFINTRNIFF